MTAFWLQNINSEFEFLILIFGLSIKFSVWAKPLEFSSGRMFHIETVLIIRITQFKVSKI